MIEEGKTILFNKELKGDVIYDKSKTYTLETIPIPIREIYFTGDFKEEMEKMVIDGLSCVYSEEIIIRNIKTNISLLRMVPIKDDYLNFNTTNENLQLLREFTYLLSKANKLVNFTTINEMVSLNDDFNSLNETQMQFLLELINLNNLVVNVISCTTLTSNGEEINEQAKRAFQRLKIKLG